MPSLPLSLSIARHLTAGEAEGARSGPSVPRSDGAIYGESRFLRHAYLLGSRVPFQSAPARYRAALVSGTASPYLAAQVETETGMTDSDAVLTANLEFYRAFGARDLAAMDALWARQAPVACIHPGWPALVARDAVMESWHGILANPAAPRIACYDEQVLLYGDTALVICEEELDGGTLIASNLFVREDDGWRIAHHQAGQLVARQPQRRSERPS